MLLDANTVRLINEISCFLLDMDGTLYLGNRWIPGAPEFLKAIRASGRRFCLVTNNSSRSARSYIQKLWGLGLEIEPSAELVTSGQATIDYLNRHYPGRRVFLLGNESLTEEFLQSGIALDETYPELVVTAFDTSLTYARLRTACDFVRDGLPYIATHPDYNCPAENGLMPDIGAIHAFIKASTGREPDLVVGKPQAVMIDYALRRAQITRAQAALVGDRLYTDIAAGRQNGLTSILVLSGETTAGLLAASEIKPDLVFRSVADITPYL